MNPIGLKMRFQYSAKAVGYVHLHIHYILTISLIYVMIYNAQYPYTPPIPNQPIYNKQPYAKTKAVALL